MLFRVGASPSELMTIRKIHELLDNRMALRVGETSVVSSLVHMQDPTSPNEISASQDSDAGKAFYQRENSGEIMHIDIFHSTGYVAPSSVASSLRTTLKDLSFLEPETGRTYCLDFLFPYIDIQTGLGGGRMDGPLSYGREEGARKAHMTHVHLTTVLTPETVSSLLAIIKAVESAVIESGLELRKIKKVMMSKGGSSVDLSDYRASSDSLLRNTSHKSSSRSKGTTQYRQEALARLAAEKIGSAEDALNLLENLERGLRHGEFAKLKTHNEKTGEEIRQAISRSSLAMYNGQKYILTEDGRLALSYLRLHSQEIEAYLRRLLWSLPQKSFPGGKSKGIKIVPGQGRGRGVVLPMAPGRQLSALAVPETILSRGVRRAFSPSDLRFSYIRERKGSPVILLIDASASMAGRRISAAKELARHLCYTGKEKVSVVAFQDAEAEVISGFTRNLSVIEEGLGKVHAAGLTPLAKGLEKALEIASKSMKKPLVLCVTDGIPTVPSKTLSPVDDAINAARSMRQRGIRLGCIGLEPNRRFLREMVSAAGGTLYIVDELDASTLANIAKKEREQ
jgi:magnesium chelatase subunit D